MTRAILLPSILLFAFLIACVSSSDSDSGTDDDAHSGDDDSAPGQYASFAIVLDPDAPPALTAAAKDAAYLLSRANGGTVPIIEQINDRPDVLNIILHVQADSQNPAESYVVSALQASSDRSILIEGADSRGAQYGLYALLEYFGFRFFHPEQTYYPPLRSVSVPDDLHLTGAPSYSRRGFHVHTMHPIEASEFLVRDDPVYLQYAMDFIDWLARNRQNYYQFELLRTVDYQAALPHLRAIVDYAHERLVDAGIVVTFVFAQQKAWRIIPEVDCECRPEMEQALDLIMQVPWDHINLEMGSTEFTKVDDRLQVKWMDNVVDYLAEAYPGTDASVKVHVSSGQWAPNYNVNFNFLPQFADPRMGVYPHTVQFYDLRGPAPTYGNTDFHEILNWMLERVGERKVYYYPETAYWCSFDIDVPLFLPVYFFNRWKDADLLKDAGIDGIVTFTSGHEWLYWLSDWAVARYAWDARQHWDDPLADYASVFGDAAGEIKSAVSDLTLIQEDRLIMQNLASYLAGQDTWDELGYMVGETTHPKPVTFFDLYHMDVDEASAFEAETVNRLEALAGEYEQVRVRVEAVRAQIPQRAAPWFEELADALQVNAYRAAHAYHLYAGATARRLAELGENPGGEDEAAAYFQQAQAITPQFLDLMRKREAAYRYPVPLSSGWQRSLTSYDYRYLWQASTGYWYVRYEKQAIDKNFNPFLMNVVDPIWFFQ